MPDVAFFVEWYVAHCDGDWEHGNGLMVQTLDNPGWQLRVNVEDTELVGRMLDWCRIERSDDD